MYNFLNTLELAYNTCALSNNSDRINNKPNCTNSLYNVPTNSTFVENYRESNIKISDADPP